MGDESPVRTARAGPVVDARSTAGGPATRHDATGDDAGEPTREWTLRSEDVDHPTVVRGELLGYVSSERDDHTHSEEFTPPSWKCSACRWIELTLIRTDRGTYVVHQLGRTIVPGEVDRVTLDETDSPDEVVEVLTVRRSPTRGGVNRVFLPQPSARVLAQSARRDLGLREAFRDRAVA